MRIDILVPVYVDLWNKGIRDILEPVKAPDIALYISNLHTGVPSMESEYDVAIASHLIVAKAEQLEIEGSDGIVLYCFKDPALNACKEKLNIPIVGLRESSIALASLIGNNIAVITSRKYSVSCYKRALEGKVKLVTDLGIPVLELSEYRKVEASLDKKLADVVDAGCDVVVLGCGSIIGLDFKRLSAKHGIEIVLPAIAALSTCEYLIRASLRQSRLAFPTPEIKDIKL
ncbi:MAG: hypothetical protein GX660_05150 [Clostridiaceae bacterium]|nr:hypothetical protein [Clostridiaceae bacterium]